jgi:hypothetical protein
LFSRNEQDLDPEITCCSSSVVILVMVLISRTLPFFFQRKTQFASPVPAHDCISGFPSHRLSPCSQGSALALRTGSHLDRNKLSRADEYGLNFFKTGWVASVVFDRLFRASARSDGKPTRNKPEINRDTLPSNKFRMDFISNMGSRRAAIALHS